MFGHVVARRANQEIADELGITERTVKFHRSHLMQKIGAKSVVELVHFANRFGIASPARG